MRVFECDSNSHTGDGNAKTITLGYKPRVFVLENSTDVINHYKSDTMATNTAIKTAANGTRTNSTEITFDSPNPGQITIAATANVNAKVYHWYAVKGD